MKTEERLQSRTQFPVTMNGLKILHMHMLGRILNLMRWNVGTFRTQRECPDRRGVLIIRTVLTGRPLLEDSLYTTPLTPTIGPHTLHVT